MAKFGEGGELLKCSFCGKSQKQVKKLIAGPGVYICDECIDLCNEIIRDELPAQDAAREAAQARHANRKKSPRQLAAEARAQSEAQQLHLSIREIYRKLASALHPDREPDPAERERMMSLTGRRTVPQIFIGETHVGGCDDLMALDGRGGLMPLLQPT